MQVTQRQLVGVEQCFRKNFEERGELGASVAIYQGGTCVLSLSAGVCEKGGDREWTERTLVPVYSATKALASAVTLEVLQKAGLSIEDTVSRVWPIFPQPKATFAQLLSHQCGLSGLDLAAPVEDYAAVISAIESQVPAWRLGVGHGYHPRTFGFLLDEVVRRIDGRSLAQVWEQDFRSAGGWDLWLAPPEREHDRIARLYPGKMGAISPEEQPFYDNFGKRGTITQKAFSSPKGLHSVAEMNSPSAWGLGLPAMGGIASAKGLAEFYQALLGGRGFGSQTATLLRKRQVNGADLVLKRATSFGLGCMLDPIDTSGRKVRHLFGSSHHAFGHPGAGGSHAFADPERGLSFAYVMNQMELSVMPGPKSLDMVRALYA